MPNKWIYHKNSDLNEVLDYIRNLYDSFRIEDQSEEENQNLKQRKGLSRGLDRRRKAHLKGNIRK
jgi:hypothetical protein